MRRPQQLSIDCGHREATWKALDQSTESLRQRDFCHKEIRKLENRGNEARCGSGHIQPDATKWLRYHGSTAAVVRGNHKQEHTTALKSGGEESDHDKR